MTNPTTPHTMGGDYVPRSDRFPLGNVPVGNSPYAQRPMPDANPITELAKAIGPTDWDWHEARHRIDKQKEEIAALSKQVIDLQAQIICEHRKADMMRHALGNATARAKALVITAEKDMEAFGHKG